LWQGDALKAVALARTSLELARAAQARDKALEAALGEPESTKLAWRPQTPVEVGGDDAEQLLKLLDALEEDDDVQTVWGNYEVSEEAMARLG